MTPSEFKKIREQLGLSQEAWGRALGYSMAHMRQQISKMEAGRVGISPAIAGLARALSLQHEAVTSAAEAIRDTIGDPEIAQAVIDSALAQQE